MIVVDNARKWIWKDGKCGFEALLKQGLISEADANNNSLSTFETECNKLAIYDEKAIETLERMNYILPADLNWLDRLNHTQAHNLFEVYNTEMQVAECIDNVYFGEVYNFICSGRYPSKADQLGKFALQRKCQRFKLLGDELMCLVRGMWKKCIRQDQVASVLRDAHDREGHFGVQLTARKLRKYYWPTITQDTKAYIQGCLNCAKFARKHRAERSSLIVIKQPNILHAMDFIGPFEPISMTMKEIFEYSWPFIQNPSYKGYILRTPGKSTKRLTFTHVLLIVDYFSRFVWTFPTCGDTEQEVVRCLTWLYNAQGPPLAVYLDCGNHFNSKREIVPFFKSHGVLRIPSPVAHKHATGLAEVCNDIIQNIMKKVSKTQGITHLFHSPYEIHLGHQPYGEPDLNLPIERRQEMQTYLLESNFTTEISEDQFMAAFHFINQRDKIRLFVNERSKEKKEKATKRYNCGVQTHENPYKPGDLVMLYDDAVAKKKLHESYRGPFRVFGFGSDRAHSYSLEQLNETRIKRTFHGDQLRLFILRTGHLVTSEEAVLPSYQNIRAPRNKARSPTSRTAE